MPANRLARFFRNPVRYLLRERLGIHLEENEGLIEPREPFALDFDSQREIRSRLLAAELTGRPPEHVLAALRASGLVQIGEVGRRILEMEHETVANIAARLKAYRAGAPREPVALGLEIGDMRVVGSVSDLWPRGRIIVRLNPIRAADLVEAWVHHLCLNVLRPQEVEPVTYLIGAGGTKEEAELRFAPVADAEEHLRRLLALYWQGLQGPLHFFPRSARAYVDAGKDPLGAARKEWETQRGQGGSQRLGEGEEAYYKLAFRDLDPLDEQFETLAEAIFGSLLSCAGDCNG